MMSLRKRSRIIGFFVLAGIVVTSRTYGQGQQQIFVPSITGDNQGLVNQNNSPTVFVGPQPGAAASSIDNYINQNEQINLDPNSGNLRVLRTNQKALLNDFVTILIEVKNVDVREIRNAIRTICGLEGGRAEGIMDKAGNRKFIQVICPKFQLPYLQNAIKALDEAWVGEENTGSVTFYYKALNRDAADVDFIAQHYASDMAATGAFSVIDTRNNAIARLEEPYRAEEYLKAAKEIDMPANQVLIEAKVIEINENNDLKLGLDWINWKNGPGRNLFEFFYQGVDAESRNRRLTSVFDPFRTVGDVAGSAVKKELEDNFNQYYAAANYLLTSNFIDFLQVNGKARVLTHQNLMVQSAATAKLAAADEVVALVSNPGDVNNVGPDTLQGLGNDILTTRQTSTRFVVVPSAVRDSNRRLNNRPAGSTGVFLSLTPFVGLQSMELVISVANADLNGLAPNGQPIINTRTLNSTVRLLDGQPYVITGLKRRHDARETAKAPGLGDLPFLGYLFGGETTINRENDVVIVLTPHFFLSSQANIHTPVMVKELASVVENKTPRSLPPNPYGFDQWLLDK